MPTTVRMPIDLRNPRVTSLAGNSFFNVTGLTAHDLGAWEFVKDVDGKVYGLVDIPQNLAGTPAASVVLILGANATTGVTRMSVGHKAVADDAESINPASITGITAQDITAPATARNTKKATFTVSETLAAGDQLLIELFHEGAHANDTLAVNTELYAAYLQIDLA